MDDLTDFNATQDNNALKEILEQQDKMSKERLSKRIVTHLPFKPYSQQYITPSYSNYKEKLVKLSGNANDDAKLLFSAFYVAHYLYFYTEGFANNRKREFITVITTFIDFLNEYQFDSNTRVGILKDYETYRVSVEKLKPQSTGLKCISCAIREAINFDGFQRLLNDSEYAYLYTLTKTKPAPDDNVVQVTLTDWIGSHTWLRRDDVGIGHNLYASLGSPKTVITSFRITIVTALREIQQTKDTLIHFFRSCGVTLDNLPEIQSENEFDSPKKFQQFYRRFLLSILNLLRTKYHEYNKDKKNIQFAFKLVLAELVQHHSQDYVYQCFILNKEITVWNNRQCIARTSKNEATFSLSFLRKLILFANTSSDLMSVPTCQAENICFSWIMAYQTVQPSDIFKLSSNDFKFIRRRGGEITHIDLEYYKGRSGRLHQVKTLETKTYIGKAVLQFLQDKKKFNQNSPLLESAPKLETGMGAPASMLLKLCGNQLRDKIEEKLGTEFASSVFLDSTMALLSFGNRYNQKIHKSIKNYRTKVNKPLNKSYFSLTAIKNSSIHARSDSFTPTQLLNYHSHSNDTERKSYLSRHNEEWINNCGRITRAVMQDLLVNLYRANDKDQKLFNNEFIKASVTIDSKKDDVLSRMKLVTGKQNGKIDDFGFTDLATCSESNGQYNTLYLVDCPETVMKLKHYLNEVRIKHSSLINNAPEFLLFTVLPTVEWIENIFEKKSFGKKSMTEGLEIYQRYKYILPPLFSAQMGS